MVDVPGYGRFDPDLPSWLRLESDGKLYNVNASANRAADGSFQAVRPWTPPEGYVGGVGYTFTPESALPPPVVVPPAPEPVPPPAPEPAKPDPYVAYIAYQRAVLRAVGFAVEAESDTLEDIGIALDQYEAALAAKE